MLNSGSVRDYEFQKFVESPTRPGKPAIEVADVSSKIPSDYDNGKVLRPTSTQEVFQFFKGLTLVRTITLNYTDSTKQDLDTWSYS
jgi:hypothetical protein